MVARFQMEAQRPTEPRAKLRVSQPATVWLTAPKSLCQSLCQRPPRRPVLPVFPTYKAFAVNNLHFSSSHGMEEVVGSIPTRSTNFPSELSRASANGAIFRPSAYFCAYHCLSLPTGASNADAP